MVTTTITILLSEMYIIRDNEMSNDYVIRM